MIRAISLIRRQGKLVAGVGFSFLNRPSLARMAQTISEIAIGLEKSPSDVKVIARTIASQALLNSRWSLI